jgi:flagellar hook-basal body complex protein FliE
MLNDLRFAFRMLRHDPGFALVAIGSLALGIGANAAIFSFAYFMLLRPLPVPNASKVMVVQSQFRGEGVANLMEYSLVSYPDFDDLRKRSRSFAGLTASEYFQFGFAADKTALPEMKFGALVSGNFFQTLEGAMDKVQEMQSGADQQVASVLLGDGQDLHAAMVAVEKADLTFQMMMQVRNKIVQAYQTISQMQF